MPDDPPSRRFPDVFSLHGEVALITGGGTGLGFAIASAFVQAGARVVLMGRNAASLESASAALGPSATYEVQDVTKHQATASVVDRVTERTGPISIMVNNAGIHLKKPATETTETEFASVIETHVLGAFALSRAVAPAMMLRRHGSMLFMASMAALIGMPKVVAYSAAKAAYLGMVRALAAELSPCGVRVNAIAPGWIETPMLHRALEGDPERQSRILGRTPMGRFGQPDDIGWTAVYLCSPAGRFVTGTVLAVDGGASIGF